ncbi:MAG: hypothetical protein PHT83_01175 [Bacilli bacterium]|nr:hypothetical protein [Bacilli bacterium]
MDLYVNVFKRNKFETIYVKIALVLYVLYTLMPIVPRLVDAYVFASATILLFFILLMNHIEEIISRKKLIYIPFLILIMLEIVFLSIYSNNRIYDLYDIFLINLPILLFFVVLNDKELVKIVFFTALFSIVVTCITTTIYLRYDNEASRWLAAVSDPNDPYFIQLNFRNVGGFESIYSLVILIPFIVGLFKVKRIDLKIFIVVIALILANIYYSKYAIAIILASIGLMTILLPRIKSVKKILLFLGILVVSFVILRNEVGDFLYYLSNFVSYRDVSNKIRVVGDFLNGVENTTGFNTRFPLLEESLLLIKENIWLGTTFTKNGFNSGHSFILDTFVKYGMLGIVSIILMYTSVFVLLYKKFKDNKLYGYIVLSCIIAIIASVLNPGNWYFIILFIIPIFAMYFKDRSIVEFEQNYILFNKIYVV